MNYNAEIFGYATCDIFNRLRKHVESECEDIFGYDGPSWDFTGTDVLGRFAIRWEAAREDIDILLKAVAGFLRGELLAPAMYKRTDSNYEFSCGMITNEGIMPLDVDDLLVNYAGIQWKHKLWTFQMKRNLTACA